jgi:hypothetical protein
MTIKPTNTRDAYLTSTVDAVRAAINGVEDGKYNTVHMRDAAGALIDLRTTFTDRYGNLDLQGNSFAYREAVREVMSRAGVPDSDRPRLMQAIRYHLGNILRERYTAEELAEHGLLATTPVERQRKDRVQRSKVLRASMDPAEEISDPAEIVAALRSAALLVGNIDLDALAAVDRKSALVFANDLAKRLSTVRSTLRA